VTTFANRYHAAIVALACGLMAGEAGALAFNLWSFR
jgi:hypothetical protein